MVARLASVLVVLSHAADREEHSRSWKTMPREGDLPAHELRQFYATLDSLMKARDETDSQIDSRLVSWEVESSLDVMHWKNDVLAEQLQGIWWSKHHPSQGNSLFAMVGGDQPFNGSSLTNPAGYAYVSFVQPLMMGVPNNGGNRSSYGQYHDLDLAYAFPELRGDVKPGDASPVNVRLKGFYNEFPVPAAALEGWTSEEMGEWMQDPKRQDDPAYCFCSVIYEGPNVIARNNFGRFSYYFLRVADGNGQPTNYWGEFLEEMRAQGIEQLAGFLPRDKMEEMPQYVQFV